jgi:hypothetical protein
MFSPAFASHAKFSQIMRTALPEPEAFDQPRSRIASGIRRSRIRQASSRKVDEAHFAHLMR